MIITPGAASVSIDVRIVDDSGLAVTGLLAAGFPATYFSLAGNTAATAITLSDLALITTAYSSGGVKERSGSAGVYRLDIPNAAVATAGDVTIYGEASGKHLLCEPLAVVQLPSADTSGRVDIGKVRGSTINTLQGGRVDAYVSGYAVGMDPAAQILVNPSSRIYADVDGYVSILPASSVNVLTINGSPADTDSGLLIVSVGGSLGPTPANITQVNGTAADDIAGRLTVNVGNIGDADVTLDSDNLLVVSPTNIATAVWASISRTLTSLSGLSVNVADKTGFSLVSSDITSIIAGVWNRATSLLTTTGSIGKKLADWALGTDNRVLVSANTHTSGETVAGVTGGVSGGGASTEDIVAALEEAEFAKASDVDIDVTVELPG